MATVASAASAAASAAAVSPASVAASAEAVAATATAAAVHCSVPSAADHVLAFSVALRSGGDAPYGDSMIACARRKSHVTAV
jgi:hypothetical protein